MRAAEITREIEGLAIADWLNKEDVQRQMRLSIKRHLRAAGHPKGLLEATTARIMDLMRVRLRR